MTPDTRRVDGFQASVSEGHAGKMVVHDHTRHWMVVTLLIALLSAGFLVYAGFKTKAALEAVDLAWDSHARHETEVASAYNGLRAELGYGGFIHHFKNYVLRRDPRDIEDFESDVLRAVRHLERLGRHLGDEEQVGALETIRSTVDEYRQKARFAESAPADMATSELDSRVWVDDGPAVRSLRVISEGLAKESARHWEDAKAKVSDVHNSLATSLFGGFLILLGSGVVIVLMHRVAVSNARLREANATAMAASQEKSEFLSRMSHELRTPLNGIQGFAQLLDAEPDAPHDKRQYWTRHISRAGTHLLELIDEVVELSHIEAGRLTVSIETVDPRLIVDEALSTVKAMADKRSLSIIDETKDFDLPMVRADRLRLRQVLLNLLSNAVKYNRHGGTIKLGCDVSDPGGVRFSVMDNGAGIGDEGLERLFHPFDRLGQETTEIEGTGLGLTICKQLIDLMGGEIGVESAVGMGSTFWFVLPFAMETASMPKTVKAVDHRPLVSDETVTGAILYVEDNPANAALMEAILGEVPGIKLDTVQEGELAVSAMRAKRPDLVLMDINLRGMSGLDVLRAMRADPALSAIPVIAVSARAIKEDVERCLAAGFEAYVTKPVDVNRLLREIRMRLTERAAA